MHIQIKALFRLELSAVTRYIYVILIDGFGAASIRLHLDVEPDQAEGPFDPASRNLFWILHFYHLNNQAIRERLGSDTVKTAVLQRLPNFEREIDMRNAESTRIISNGPSLDTLGELTSLWEGLSDNASSWSRELTQCATGRCLDCDARASCPLKSRFLVTWIKAPRQNS